MAAFYGNSRVGVSREFLPQWLKPVFSMPLYRRHKCLLHPAPGYSNCGIVLTEHLLVVAIPVALEESRGIVCGLELEELFKLRVARFHLPALSETMIGKVVTAVVLDGQVNQRAEAARGILDAHRV